MAAFWRRNHCIVQDQGERAAMATDDLDASRVSDVEWVVGQRDFLANLES